MQKPMRTDHATLSATVREALESLAASLPDDNLSVSAPVDYEQPVNRAYWDLLAFARNEAEERLPSVLDDKVKLTPELLDQRRHQREVLASLTGMSEREHDARDRLMLIFDKRIQSATVRLAHAQPSEDRNDTVKAQGSRPGLQTTGVLDLFGGIWGSRGSLADALNSAEWTKKARISAGRRGKGGAATWNPILLAESIAARLARRERGEAARDVRTKLTRHFRDDRRLLPWRDEWEAQAQPSAWYGLDDNLGRTGT